MKNITILSIMLLGIIVFSFENKAFSEDESISAIFLNQSMGARPAGMGEAFIAMHDDVNMLFWNPGALVRLTKRELLITHTSFLNGFNDEYFTYVRPLSAKYAIGINAYISYNNSLEKYDTINSITSNFKAYDSYLTIGWSLAFNHFLSLGINLKGIYQIIDKYSAWSIATDVGFLVKAILPNLNIGLTLKNLGKPIKFINKAWMLPTLFEIGGSYTFWENRLLFNLDISKVFFQEIIFKTGLEYNIQKKLFFRLGYKYSQFGNDLGPLSGLTTGFGLDISEYKIDYSYAPYFELGDIHRISITFPFRKTIEEEERLIANLEKQLLNKQKKVINSYIKKAKIYSKEQKYALALEYYQKVAAIQPNFSDIDKYIKKMEDKVKKIKSYKHFNLGMQAYKKQDYITAMLEWNKVKEIDNNYRQVLKWLAKVNKKLLSSNSKSNSKVKSSKSKSNKFASLYKQGLNHLEKQEYAQAISIWQQILKASPRNYKAKKYLTLTKQQQTSEVENLLASAEEHLQENNLIKAVALWRKVLKIQAKNPVALEQLYYHYDKMKELGNELYLKGVQMYVKNNLAKAIAYWQEVLILNPNHHKALKHLKQVKSKLQDIQSME